jgi:RloB-like protein
MARQFPKTPRLDQSVGRVKPKVELVIVCEGRNTEPQYFKDCIAHYSAGMVRLALVVGAGVPKTLVDRAINERKKLIAKQKASQDSFDLCFRVWAVFDRDAHPGIPEAFESARLNSIDVGFSDPCFELWPILHLEDYGAQDGRAQLQSRLAGLMSNYDHQHGALIDFPQIQGNFSVAHARAKAHLKARVAEDCPLENPSTTVGDLVLKIIQNGKKAFK